MTTNQLTEQFFFLVSDETTSEEQVLNLLNIAADKIYSSRIWNFLKKVADLGAIIATQQEYDLPADFMLGSGRAWIVDSVGNYTPLHFVPFQQAIQYSFDPYAVYLNEADMTFGFCQTPVSASPLVGKHVIFPYQYQPAELTDGDTPPFNRGCHMILAFEAAKIFWYNDQSEKDRNWSPEMQREYNTLKSQMIMWDLRSDAGASPSWEPAPWVDFGNVFP